MSAKDMSLEKWIQTFQEGNIELCSDTAWWDWFCRGSSLLNKTKHLGPKVVKFASTKRVKALGLKNVYVFFKNNCPMVGPLYDSFSICDRKTKNVIFWFTPKSGHTGKAELAGINEKGEFKTFVEGSYKDVIDYLNS